MFITESPVRVEIELVRIRLLNCMVLFNLEKEKAYQGIDTEFY